MQWFVVGLVVALAGLAAVGLRRNFTLASWALALGGVTWALALAAALIGWQPAQWDWERAVQHRHVSYVMLLGVESAVACAALALAGFREARTRAAVAGWLACGFAGLVIALLR
jgi:hypothetical protein